MKYLDTKENSIEDSVTRVLMGEKKLDPVNPKMLSRKSLMTEKTRTLTMMVM